MATRRDHTDPTMGYLTADGEASFRLVDVPNASSGWWVRKSAVALDAFALPAI
ncbi:MULTISPECIES: hypothetical protein [Rhodococcus]|uniref:hypothetical protein n=1 Tax=Rhodococcus TaxID=1827 RepID=UPI0012E91790|nr:MULTISPECIES: hypothetical protein [Rhodococcus]MCE4161629.1 hypothetical protein [Rhodococcus sp. Ni2]